MNKTLFVIGGAPIALYITYNVWIVVFTNMAPEQAEHASQWFIFAVALPIVCILFWLIKKNAAAIGSLLGLTAGAVAIVAIAGGLVWAYMKNQTVDPWEVTRWEQIRPRAQLPEGTQKPESLDELKTDLAKSLQYFPAKDGSPGKDDCVDNIAAKIMDSTMVAEGDFPNYLDQLDVMTAQCHAAAARYLEERNQNKYFVPIQFMTVMFVLGMITPVLGVVFKLRWKNAGGLVAIMTVGTGGLALVLSLFLHSAEARDGATRLWLDGLFVRVIELILVGLSILVNGVQKKKWNPKTRQMEAPSYTPVQKLVLALLTGAIGYDFVGNANFFITTQTVLTNSWLTLPEAILAYQLGLAMFGGIFGFFLGIIYKTNYAVKGMD